MPISYVVCAAGLGTRTREISFVPKPFLKLAGKTLLEWSVESLPYDKADQMILVFLESFRPYAETCDYLKTKNFEIMYLEEPTRGQAETALRAKAAVKNSKLVVYNSDTMFVSDNLHKILHGESGGLIPCSVQEGNVWSFCEASGSGPVYNVTKVTEKVRISPYCSIGLYYFSEAAVFFDIVESELKKSSGVELYVAPLYNTLLNRGFRVSMILVNEFKPMGSVAQIQEFWGVSLEQLKIENR